MTITSEHKPRLLIVRREQFGYHTDIFKWCENLRGEYEVSTVTFGGKPRISLDGVTNHYVPLLRGRTVRGALFILDCLWRIVLSDAVIVSYFPGCGVLKRLLPLKKMILDVRTMSIEKDDRIRAAADDAIRRAAGIYDYCTPISKGVAEKLGLPSDRMSILPLGADTVDSSAKSYDSLNLLYIGTLTNRNIDLTVKGFARAVRMLPQNARIHYDIIGDGRNGELGELEKTVGELGMSDFVSVHGYIRHDLAGGFLKKCNVGVSFVPMTPYFDFQPVTKTFEYALSGLFVIGTATCCNAEVINAGNGILILDNEEDFARAVVETYGRRRELDSDRIRESLSEYRWPGIVNGHLRPVLEKVYGI